MDRTAINHRYNTSERGRERRRRYDNSPKGFIKRRERVLSKRRVQIEQQLVAIRKELEQFGECQ